MSPFADSQPQAKPSSLNRFTAQPALIVCLVCLLAGLGVIAWKARGEATAAKARARTVAQAHGAALAVELNQAISAAEVLGALAQQSGGTIPNFQRVAAELLATRPSLAALELQPGGIVSDIAPRAGQERALGRNLLNDPTHRPGVLAARQRRGPTVSGPVTLYRGEKGFVVRVPVIQRARDNRETLWGFVAASLRLPEALAQAQLNELAKQGYNYNLFAPAQDQQPAVGIAAHGELSSKAMQQVVHAQNPELRLALQPQGGWYNKTTIALQALGVLVFSGLLCLLVNVLESRDDMEAALTEANQRLGRETADRKQTQDDYRALKDSIATTQTDLKQTRFALQQAEAKLTELNSRLESVLRGSEEASQAAQMRLQEAELKTAELQARLDATLQETQQAAQARQAEVVQVHAALQQVQEANSQLQTRLAALTQAEKEAAAGFKTRQEQDQATIAKLQARLEAATRTASEAAETSAAQLRECEAHNRDLEARLQAAEQAAAQAAQLALQLQETQAEVLRRREACPEPAAPTAAVASVTAALQEDSQPEAPELTRALAECSTPSEPAATELTPAPQIEETSEPVTEELPAPVPAETSVPASNGEPASEAAPLPATNSELILGACPTTPMSPEAPGAPLAPAAPESPAAEKPAKAAKRKKSRRVDQMDLFGGQAPAEPAPVTSPAEAPAQAPVIEPLGLPLLDLPAPAQPVLPAESEKVAEPMFEQASTEAEAPIPAVPAPGIAELTLAEPAEAKPAAPAASIPELRAIEGLDTNEGLTRAEGNPKLYLKALHHFAEHQAHIPAKIRDALVQGDSAAAEQLIRTLETATTEIGAAAVLRAAETLGRAVREQTDPSGIEFLWAELEKGLGDLISDLKFLLKPKEEKPSPARPLPSAPPVNPAQLRKAVHQILPLLTDGDPGAKDCLKDNRATFRSAFTPEAYMGFEHLVKSSDFSVALEQLKKAVRKHGISV